MTIELHKGLFTPLELGDVVRVHDYEVTADGFGYVGEDLINRMAGETDRPYNVIARPIITPLNILDMLQSDVCVCTEPKQNGRSHCSACYRSLPPELGKGLYRRFRSGYEQAFLQSLEVLIENGRTTIAGILAAVPKPKGDNQ